MGHAHPVDRVPTLVAHVRHLVRLLTVLHCDCTSLRLCKLIPPHDKADPFQPPCR